MARRVAPLPAPPPVPLALAVSRTEATTKLEERIALGKELQARQLHSHDASDAYENEAGSWSDYNADLLKSLFTNDEMAQEYGGSFIGGFFTFNEGQAFQALRRSIDSQIAKLESILGRLALYPEPSRLVRDPMGTPRDTSKVFVVHGHDEGARQSVARFLEKIRLEAIILQEQPDQGLTVIEKFESFAGQVGFAVVLLTPDDIVGQEMAPAQTARARQNVIFELGYFAGKLGRGRTCLLRKGAVEIPSDLYGVIYTELDASDGWQLKLGKELKAANLRFDSDKLFG